MLHSGLDYGREGFAGKVFGAFQDLSFDPTPQTRNRKTRADAKVRRSAVENLNPCRICYTRIYKLFMSASLLESHAIRPE